MAKSVARRGKRLPVKSEVQTVDVEQEISELTEAEVKELDREICQLSLGVNTARLEIGKRLAVICKTPVEGGKRAYNVLGYSSFQDYCEKRLGIARSVGYDLMALAKQSLAGMLTTEEVEGAGWAKVAKLLPLINDGIITKKNINKWMKAIADKSFDEIRETINLARMKAKEKGEKPNSDYEDEEEESEETDEDARPSKEGTQTAPEEVYNLHVPLYKPQWENAQLALKKAENITGSDKMPWLMDCIFTSFLSEGFSTKEQALETLCQRIEQVFSVRIVALHDKSSQVVFGEKIVKLLQSRESKKKR